ncbi:MAG: hypothetical protein PVF49_07810 [Anaerolineales bacterium]|jgi:hypothetical protein
MSISTGRIRPWHLSLLSLSILTLAVAACNLPNVVTQEPPPGTEAATEPIPLESETEPSTEIAITETEEVEIEIPPDTYTIAVIVDLTSEPVTREQAQAVVDEASTIFQARTGFSIMMVDFVEMMPEQAERRSDLPDRYLDSHPDIIPNGIVMFSFGDNNQAQVFGGYSTSTHGPSSTSSHFPIDGDETLITVSTIHFSHRYAICGYDPDNRDELISDVSLGGQCRNQPGTPCVERFGYSMCANAVDDLYASTPTYMVASSIVHEIAHPFGRHGNGDHYGTQECQAEMGWNASNWTFNLDDSQEYAVMCPYVYDLIVESYRP